MSVDENYTSKLVALCRQIEAMGCAVVVFTPEELRGAWPARVEYRLVELGRGVIDCLATEPRKDEDGPTEED